MAEFDWLKEQHPIYKAMKDRWAENERRLHGGDDVLDEVTRFDWEMDDGDHHKARKAQATYLNFPDIFLTDLIGHLIKKSPRPDSGLSFGGLGEVRRERSFAAPTRAEMVYYNVDGVGNDGSQWDNFWTRVMKMAGATGHRWVFVESPTTQPTSQADEIAGLRPYLVPLSPLAVPNWEFVDGRLAWAVIQIARRRMRVENGRVMGNQTETWYLLVVRKGHRDLGAKFVGGGWWLVNADLVEEQTGTWDKTRGEIPLFPVYCERDEGTEKRPSISRPLITEMGNAAIAYMNLSSAADFDAWDAAMSIQFFEGVDAEGFNLALSKMKEGSRWVPLPVSRESNATPTVKDGSTGAVTADVFSKRMVSKREEALMLAAQSVTSAPYSSGASKEVGFKEHKSPRLALLASELEQAQNTALHFLEMRFGIAQPTAVVVWPRDFELDDVLTAITEHFELEKLSGLKSTTLGAKLMIESAIERGLLSDDADIATVEGEYKKAATDAEAQKKAMADAQVEATKNPSKPGEDDSKKPEPSPAE